MGKFFFRLEKVQEHRQRVVDQRSREVAEAQKRVAHLAVRRSEMDTAIISQEHEMVTAAGRGLLAGELIAGTAWLDRLHRIREELDQQRAAASADLEEARARLQESWRDCEVLGRLKARQETDWKADQFRMEQRTMDEIGQVQAFRHEASKISH
jgi:flagellar export protein FliJ